MQVCVFFIYTNLGCVEFIISQFYCIRLILCFTCCIVQLFPLSIIQSPANSLGKESLDRTDDRVYECTTAVVRSVMSLSQKAPSVRSDELVDLIKVCLCYKLSLVPLVFHIILAKVQFPYSLKTKGK